MIRIFKNQQEYDKAESSIPLGEKVVWLFRNYDKQEIFTMIESRGLGKTIRLDQYTNGKSYIYETN